MFNLFGTPEERAKRDEQKRLKTEQRQKSIDARQLEQGRQAQDLRLLEMGKLPSQATERLQAIGASTGDAELFTSGLSPVEAGLLRREGYRVRGLVTGSAMYHVGMAYASSTNDCEVTVLSQAYDTATALAVSRMRQELTLIGAHGAVGVRLSVVRHEWADKTVEVQLIGTAIQGPDATSAQPWICDLSAEEWYGLRRAGYAPTSLVWGHCTWFILTTMADECVHMSLSNQEMTHWSSAFSRARDRAMQSVLAQARHWGASGIVGVKIAKRLDEVRLTGTSYDGATEREHHNLVVSIIGTGIRTTGKASHSAPATVPIISLSDGSFNLKPIGPADLSIV